MILHLLPTRTANAAENMALDFLLLQRYPEQAAARFRHYEWRAPAVTFGYSQKVAFVREQLCPGEDDPTGRIDLCRRPTGGGMVDHRDDWTYALVIPRGHALEEMRAAESYRAVHEALAAALRAQHVPATLKPCVPEAEDCAAGAAGVKSGAVLKDGLCFQRAEVFDIVHVETGEKIAGAAQKRNKHGLLFQGSIWRPAASVAGAGTMIDWDRFEEEFTVGLAAALKVTPEHVSWPELNEDEVSGLSDRYSSPEWIEYR